MLNPFKAYALAADARRAEAILEPHFYGGNWSLPTMATNAVNRVEELEATCRTYCDLLGAANAANVALQGRNDTQRESIRSYQADLAEANAKIARMTSGLKRGSKAARDGAER